MRSARSPRAHRAERKPLHATIGAGNAPVIDDYLAHLQACVAEVAGTCLDDRSTNSATLE